jgi:hypothetical protein
LFASRFLSLTLIAATASLGFLVADAPQTASAADPTPGSYHSAPGSGATRDATSPSGCIQRADYPHKSTHVPGTMNGVVTTTCRVYIPEISSSAQMWETRWWGWDRIGQRGTVTDRDSRVASTNASDTCKNNTVRVTGSGFVIDVDGKTYYASTESLHVKNPCNL